MNRPDVNKLGQTPDNAKDFSSEMHVYTPDDFYRTKDGKNHLDVDIAGVSVTLPVINVGKEGETPVWVAYAHVKENPELAAAARKGLYDKLVTYLEPICESLAPGEYVTLMSPPSLKTQELFEELSHDLKEVFGEKLRYVQLIGGTDEKEVAGRATSGIVRPCDSVITKAQGKHKFIGATKEHAETLKNSTVVIGVDDVANTMETTCEMSAVADMAGFGNAASIQYFVIGTEAQWDPQGLHYPKKFPPDIKAFFQIPEVIGDLPPIRESTPVDIGRL